MEEGEGTWGNQDFQGSTEGDYVTLPYPHPHPPRDPRLYLSIWAQRKSTTFVVLAKLLFLGIKIYVKQFCEDSPVQFGVLLSVKNTVLIENTFVNVPNY